jgi:signal transduction histidine kinase
MDNQTETSGGWAPPTASSRERMLLRKLADHYYGLYLLGVLQGIVHNLNGPLQILYIRTEQLERNLHRLKDVAQSQQLADVEDLAYGIEEKIKSSLLSLDDLNAQLRNLTSDLVIERDSGIEDVNINQVIEECLFLLNANMFFKHTVNKTIKTEDALPVLRGRKMDFCVIVLNLLQNSLEAMVDAQDKHLTIESFSQGGKVIIRIQDTGCGILEQDREHIYKVCFTTKNRVGNKGRSDEHPGLGLSLVSLLVEDYNGFVTCESVPGETTFTVQIPLSG